MSATVLSPNLPKVPKIEHPAEYEPVSLEALTQVIPKLVTIFAFLAKEGLEFLKQKTPLSFVEWKVLFEHTFEA